MKHKFISNIWLLPIIAFLFLSGNAQAQTPADGAVGIAISNVTYSIPPGLLLSTSNDFYDLVVLEVTGNSLIGSALQFTYNSSSGNSLTYGTATSSYNTQYKWAVIEHGDTPDNPLNGYQYGPFTFTTEIATPTITVDPSGNYSTSTTFSWSMDGNYSNVDFLVTVAEDNALTLNPVTTTVSGNLSATITLPSAGEYYWNVKATVNDINSTNNGLNSTSSTSGPFTLTLPGPSLSAPVNGLTGVSIEPSMSWGTVTGAVSYKLYVDDADDFSTPIYAEDQGTNSAKTFDESISGFPLNNATEYWWKVSAIDNANNEYFSPIYHFYTFPNISVAMANPANGATVYTSTVLFSWTINQPVGSLKFKLQYQETNLTDNSEPTAAEWAGTASNPATSVTTTSISYSASVNGGRKYYWRVIVLDANNNVVDYSNVYTFTTAGGATVNPIPSYPTGGTTVYTNDPTLYWYLTEYAPGVTFQIKYGTDADNNNDGELDSGTLLPDPITNGTSNLYAVLNGLDPGTTYYWQVRAYYAATGETGDWSAIQSFKTHGTGTLVTPTPSYPTGGVTVYTTTPYLYWTLPELSTGLLYDVEIKSANDSFDGTVTSSTTSNDQLYLQVPSNILTPGENYHWRVRSKTNNSTSNVWSSEGTFSVAGGSTNSYAVASYPKENPILYTTKPTLYWYLEGSSLGFDHYRVAWNKGSELSDWTTADANHRHDISNVNETYYTFTSDLDYDGTYYWAVAFNDGSAYSNWSTGSFTIVGPSTVGVPQLSQPSNGSIVYSTSVNLSWYINGSTTGIQGYELVYSTSDAFVNGVTTTVDANNLSSQSYTISNATPGATYYWTVKSWYGNSDYSNPSSIFHFTVDAGAAPVQPLVGGPNNVTVSTTAPIVSWVLPVQSESQLIYELEVADNPEFNNSRIITSDVPFTQVDGLNLGNEYYWRARSKTVNTGQYSDFSPTAHFTVDQTTAVNEEEVIPKEFSVSQNYPNPFNPSTVIEFALPSNEFVTIKIYDILGREIATLVNKETNAGVHRITWNGKDNNGAEVSAGAYIYRITAGKNIVAKKMMLIK